MGSRWESWPRLWFCYLRHASQAIKGRAPDSPVVPRALSLVNWDNERLWQRTAMDVPPDHPRPTGGRLVVTEVTGRSSDPPHTHHMLLHDACARTPVRLIRVRFREYVQGLELVATCIAFPKMTHAMPVKIRRPFWQENCLTASGAVVLHVHGPLHTTTEGAPDN